MKRKLLSQLLCAVLALGVLPAPAFAGYENFTEQQPYTGQFADVPPDAWYAENVELAYEYGLINGVSQTSFAPDNSLTMAEAVKLAACLHSIYQNGATDFAASSPWYTVYAAYALENGILSAPLESYEAAATRGAFADVLAKAFPEEALEQVNSVEDGAIPDVPEGAYYADAAYLLYRAGVLTGSDASGRLLPDSTIKRSEAAAIVTRMVEPALRQTVTLEVRETLTADEAITYCMPAVFKLYSYDAKGSLLGMGSGVLIGPDGDAVTCGHVVNGVYRLVAELTDGTRHEVSIYDLNADMDIAHIQLEGSGLPYLQTAETVQAGDTVYALGYPGGGRAKLTQGTVIDPYNTDYTTPMIESSASVISGNSGGALVDSAGRLVGITVSSQSGGKPSFSVPITALKELDGSEAVSVAAYTDAHRPAASRCYAGLYPVPDFGKVTGVPLFAWSRDRNPSFGGSYFYYKMSDMPDEQQKLLQYYAALNENTFYLFSGDAFTSSAGYLYSVQLYQTTYQGYDVLAVVVTGLHFNLIGGLPQTAGFFCRHLRRMWADMNFLRQYCIISQKGK